jgi:hypothetical protein
MITIPTLAELRTQIKSDLETNLQVTIPVFGKAVLWAITLVQAAKLKLIYLAIGLTQKNIFIDTADPSSMGGTLERFGIVKLGRPPFPAVAGQYVVEVTGQVGAVINIPLTFKSNDTSLNPNRIYQLDAPYTLTGTTGQITLRALEAGTNSKLQIGDQLTATSPIALVSSIATVLSEAVQPLQPENIEDYRQKGILAYQLEPQGGAGSDYIIWANDAQGVETSYPYARSGYTSEVNLFVEATLADSTDGKGTPSAAILLDVEAVVNFDPDTTKPLNERGRRPLGMIVNYLPITVQNVDIVITGYQGLTPSIEALIFTALTENLKNVRPFVASANVLANKNDIISVPRLSFFVQVAVPQSVYDTLTFTIDGNSVSGGYVFQNGDIPYLNSITYV